jgi:hypothetical protein
MYKIEKNVPRPTQRGVVFDKTLPEYAVMMKLKIGESFEFTRARVNFVQNCRDHLRRKGSPLHFSSTSKDTFYKNPDLQIGRCWRVKDYSAEERLSYKKHKQ